MILRAPAFNAFRPERVLFRPGGVNLRASLCSVPTVYASAQPLDFLARAKNPFFQNRKLSGFGTLISEPEIPWVHVTSARHMSSMLH